MIYEKALDQAVFFLENVADDRDNAGHVNQDEVAIVLTKLKKDLKLFRVLETNMKSLIEIFKDMKLIP